MKKKTKKAVAHIAGVGTSTGSGSYYATLVPLPFGLSPIYFHSLGPLSGFLGYEFGRWLGTIGYKPALLVVLALVIVPIALFAYDAALHIGNPGILNNLGIFFFFAAAIFAFATALGIIGHKIEDRAGK